MFVSRQWAYNILISFLLLTLYTKCGSKAEDFLPDPTFEPDTFVPFRLQTFTTEESSTFIKRKDVYQEPGNLNEIGSKSNVVNDVQKLNNDAIYKDSILDGRNQVQEQQNIQSSLSSSQYQKDQNPLEYVTTNHSENSRERVMNHRITAFEKHKAHQRNYRRYGHKSNGGHKKNYSKYKKFEHERYKTKQKPNGYNNRQSPYYQSQLSYYNNESDGVDNPFELSSLSEKSRNHRYHHQHHHHHHRQHHNHYHSNHNRKTDEYSQSGKWPHLSRVQYQFYEDEKEEDLPPYIKKYKRRNKQLLDLLEGTIPPPLPLQSTESSIPFKKRKKSKHHYHNHKNPKWIVEDLFEEQKANPNNPNIDDDQYVNDAQSISAIDSLSTSSSSTTTTTVYPLDDIQNEEIKSFQQNELPGDDISVSSEEDNNNKISEKGTNNMILSKIDKQKSYEQSLPVISTEQPQQQQQRSDISQSRTNKFIYHRIDTAPRVVGAGTSNSSRKQRLPFVAITDRRLETSKTRQRDFEKNHLPMP